MVFTVLGALGGIVAFISAIMIVVRAIARQISTTERNTNAVKELTSEIQALKAGYNGHESRISNLEGWRNASGSRRY